MSQDQKLSHFLRTHAPEAPLAEAHLEHVIMAGLAEVAPPRRQRPARWLWPVGGTLLAAACAAFYLAPHAAVVVGSRSDAPATTAAIHSGHSTSDEDASVEAFAADNWQVLVAGTDRESDMQKLMDEGVTVFD